MQLRIVRYLTACLLAACTTAAPAADGPWPREPIHIVVPWPAGGAADFLARIVAQRMSVKLGQPVMVENRAGAATNIGTMFVAHAKPDGYTLLVVANSIAISPALYKNLKFDTQKDLSAIAYVGIGPVVLKVNKNLHLNTLQELIAYAKSHPGKLNYGSSGIGGTPHMATVLFEQVAGVKMTHIPYKGGGDALAALMGGQVDILINPLLGDTSSSKVESLAITGEARSPLSPKVPTFKELGYPAYDIGVYYGIMGPKAVPQDIMQKLNASINEILANKDIVDKLTTKSGIVLKPMSPTQFQDYLDKDIARWKDVVAKGHIEPR